MYSKRLVLSVFALTAMGVAALAYSGASASSLHPPGYAGPAVPDGLRYSAGAPFLAELTRVETGSEVSLDCKGGRASGVDWDSIDDSYAPSGSGGHTSGNTDVLHSTAEANCGPSTCTPPNPYKEWGRSLANYKASYEIDADYNSILVIVTGNVGDEEVPSHSNWHQRERWSDVVSSVWSRIYYGEYGENHGPLTITVPFSANAAGSLDVSSSTTYLKILNGGEGCCAFEPEAKWEIRDDEGALVASDTYERTTCGTTSASNETIGLSIGDYVLKVEYYCDSYNGTFCHPGGCEEACTRSSSCGLDETFQLLLNFTGS